MDQRLTDLMSRLTTEEKAAMLTPQSNLGDECDTMTGGKSSIGLPPWRWLQEANSNLEANCAAQDRCSTLFGGPLGMAASFHRSNWRVKGSVIGTEMRALNRVGNNTDWAGTRGETSLTGYGPNVSACM